MILNVVDTIGKGSLKMQEHIHEKEGASYTVYTPGKMNYLKLNTNYVSGVKLRELCRLFTFIFTLILWDWYFLHFIVRNFKFREINHKPKLTVGGRARILTGSDANTYYFLNYCLALTFFFFFHICNHSEPTTKWNEYGFPESKIPKSNWSYAKTRVVPSLQHLAENQSDRSMRLQWTLFFLNQNLCTYHSLFLEVLFPEYFWLLLYFSSDMSLNVTFLENLKESITGIWKMRIMCKCPILKNFPEEKLILVNRNREFRLHWQGYFPSASSLLCDPNQVN